MIKKNAVLVTGANGMLGGAVVRYLANSDSFSSVTAAARSEIYFDNNVVHINIGNICESTDWSKALENVQSVVHCAARVHMMELGQNEKQKELYWNTNVYGTLNLARQASAAGVKRFIFISTVKVNAEATLSGVSLSEKDDPNPNDLYSLSKYEAELGLKEISKCTGMELVVIRPPLIYGIGVKANFASLMSAVVSGWPLPLGSIKNKRSFVALENLVDFVSVCLTHPRAAGEVFFVSDGFDISTGELARLISEQAKTKLRLYKFPLFILRSLATVLGLGKIWVRLNSSLQIDISKSKNLLGWQPVLTMHDTILKIIPTLTVNNKITFQLLIKILFDRIFSLLLLLIFAPLMIIISFFVGLTSKGPILYWSKRVGRNNKIFEMPKFRTMKVSAPVVATHLLEAPDAYLTSIGSFLRKSSLDELPQLWSILIGNMSFVGPRPALFNQLDLIDLRTSKGVHRLLPGLTGWAQINGRDELLIPDKVNLDVYYLGKMNFILDIRILWHTFSKVIRRDGVSH